MMRYKYLIVGGGMTADAAVRGIRELDTEGTVGLIGDEPHPPYARPPLSKKLWRGARPESIWRGTQDLEVTLHAGRRAVGLDAVRHEVRDERGETYGFDRLLLATGGAPRRLPFGAEDVVYFRTLDDYRRVRALADEHLRFAVIGGGFIGAEIAAALAASGCRVTMLFPDAGIGSRIFPAGLSSFVTDDYRQRGVVVWAGETVAGMRRDRSGFVLRTRSGRDIPADAVIAGIGIIPNTELAERAELPVNDGIVVDEQLRAGAPDVFAAGDVASFHSAVLDRRMRVEHEDNALAMGRLAGRNMAGAAEPYTHLPFFYSDLFDSGYEAVGEVDNRLSTVEHWQEPYRKGVVYYLRNGAVRGVLLWNVWDQVGAARRLIAEPRTWRAADLRERLPERP
ncbi:MAG: FAD-dependent oxidoreductase [Deltaproteobacteria bacterium]|nr:FAD-dependent oxidoreductase [Deltaproteobacteria bacterium]